MKNLIKKFLAGILIFSMLSCASSEGITQNPTSPVVPNKEVVDDDNSGFVVAFVAVAIVMIGFIVMSNITYEGK